MHSLGPNLVVVQTVRLARLHLHHSRGVGVQVDPSETRTLKVMYFQLVETKRFQPRVNLMCDI